MNETSIIPNFLYFMKKYLMTRITGQNRPLFIGFSLTDRCPFHCRYCSFSNRTQDILSTVHVKHVLDTLTGLGTMAIQFTGGEPCTREDLDTLISYAKGKGLRVLLSTSGFGLKEHAEVLRSVDSVQISLDGPKDVHDYLRGDGSFDWALSAAKILKEHGRHFDFHCVITKQLIPCVKDLLAIAEDFDTSIIFQPLWEKGMVDRSRIEDLIPSRDAFGELIDLLIGLQEGKTPVGNAPYTLKVLKKFYAQKPTRKNCVAGRIYFRVACNGVMIPCIRHGFPLDPSWGINLIDSKTEKVREYLRSLKTPPCIDCLQNSIIELNAIYHFNPQMLGRALDILKAIR